MQNYLWNADEIKQIFDSNMPNNWYANGVSIDTRSLQKGDIFLAFKGENIDGHKYVEEAFKKGAAAVIVEYVPQNIDSKKCIIVDNILNALEKLAIFARKRFQGKVIGVTGSVGKTSVKRMIFEILNKKDHTYCSSGNYNNHLGLPLSLARMHKDYKYAVMEMGMSNKGEILHLTKIAKPDVAVITTIDTMHIEYLGSIENIADAKSEIFAGLPKNGIAILPRDNDYFDKLKNNLENYGHKEFITFAEIKNADIKLLDYQYFDDKNNIIKLAIDNKEYIFDFAINGKHQALNSCIVIAVLKSLNLPIDQYLQYFSQVSLEDGRGKMYHLKNNIRIINDAYNAGPASMKAALENFKLIQNKGRKIAILGDMRELGDDAIKYHLGLREHVLNSNVDKVYTVGVNIKYLFDQLPDSIKVQHYNNVEEIKKDLLSIIKNDDLILIKGSNGLRLYELEKFLQIV